MTSSCADRVPSILICAGISRSFLCNRLRVLFRSQYDGALDVTRIRRVTEYLTDIIDSNCVGATN